MFCLLSFLFINDNAVACVFGFNRGGTLERILPKSRKSTRSLLSPDVDADDISDEETSDGFSGVCSGCHDFVSPVKHSIWEDEEPTVSTASP